MTASTRTIITGLFVACGLILAWYLSHTLLIIFAGLLVACLLDAAVRGMARLISLPRPVLLAVVIGALFVVIALGLTFGGASMWQSMEDLWALLVAEARQLYERMQSNGIFDGVNFEQHEALIRDFLPDPARLFTQAGSIFGTTIGVLGDLVILIFLGIFFAINPEGYRDGFLTLMPQAYRARLLGALGATGMALRGWLVTQLAMMVLIGTLVGLLLWALGVPNALLLGVLAGSLNFIPFLGPIFSAVPVLLTLASGDTTTLVFGAIGLLVIQNLEGYVLTPYLQQRIIKLPPAWSLCVMAILGSLFGIMGVALATPIFAVIRTLVLKLYVEPRDASVADSARSILAR